MKTTLLTNFAVDRDNCRITVERAFDAPLALVWAAWTERELLDQWWAPKPWQAKTKWMDFSEGGYWLYAMVGPAGETHWARADFQSISPLKAYTVLDGFCDEHGHVNPTLPRSRWATVFTGEEARTRVNIDITYDSLEDLEHIIGVGFQEGFAAGLENLDRYLSTGFQLRRLNKTTDRARVTSYLNFPGTTEEAFTFYQEVFNGEFTGVGLRRFGDLVMPAELPPLSDADKKLVIHAELTIMGGHVLMATDSPESMGLAVAHGNNMHLNLEPESREETERLFESLSQGGEVSMPLQDMFWGAYYASFKDRFGINWMLNHQPVNEL